MRRRADIVLALAAALAEYIGTYVLNILKEVAKGKQITSSVESKEEIHPNDPTKH